ncbi:hypothetical protein IQ264_08365 [Phormidium sp. LEGE 05292]|uniref:hypothetical protein n=1 Tax=[Phormidium] sp. LEGE 05292 TaxID=767427 RepID=UPI0018817DD1|nr:hypothetical protein [Phormidium sp. LEGE 05292]MBE9225442.1 hypothetical protein [Phormidium sp. LEGE 05292]
MNKNEKPEISQLVEKITLDPILLRRLSNRVYELMLEDLRNQRDRSCNYKGLL